MLLTLKGEQREFENGLSLLDIAGKISQQLKKDALCAGRTAVLQCQVQRCARAAGLRKPVGDLRTVRQR